MAKKRGKKKGMAGTIVFVVILSAIVVGLFLYINRSKDEGPTEYKVDRTETDILLDKDLVVDYPATARETVKLFCRYTKCLYDEELEDGQINELIRKMRLLYDDELLEANPEAIHISSLKKDIDYYHQNDMLVNSFSVDKASKITYKKTKNGEMALVNLYITVKTGNTFDRTYEEMLLRKQDDNKWKILGWQTTSGANIDDMD